MGKLKVIKVKGLATVQDEGRFGYRQYGIPQCGAMDVQAMHRANELVANKPNQPVIELAINGIELEAVEKTVIGITGAEVLAQINDTSIVMNTSYLLEPGDVLSTGIPKHGVYSYLGIGGELKATNTFGSTSTYLMAGFGGMDGKALAAGMTLETTGAKDFHRRSVSDGFERNDIQTIRILKGPEWRLIKDDPERNFFKIDPSSNRMGIRTLGEPLGVDGKEIMSSAVIPGTIQIPSNGLPIVLMNDCQTTGGYPRIGKVVDEDLGLLAQTAPGRKIQFQLIE